MPKGRIRILSDTSSDEEVITQKIEKNLNERRKKEALKKQSDQKTLQIGEKKKAKKNSKESFAKRRKIKCPFCPSSLVDLPQHMRNQHGFSREDSKNAVTHFNLRKKKCKQWQLQHQTQGLP